MCANFNFIIKFDYLHLTFFIPHHLISWLLDFSGAREKKIQMDAEEEKKMDKNKANKLTRIVSMSTKTRRGRPR